MREEKRWEETGKGRRVKVKWIGTGRIIREAENRKSRGIVRGRDGRTARDLEGRGEG